MKYNLEEFETAVRQIAQPFVDKIDERFPGEDIGFAFIIYDFGGSGFSICVANSDLEDVQEVLEQSVLAAKKLGLKKMPLSGN